MMVIGVYLNTQLTYMLPDQTMFAIPDSQIGQVTSQLTIISLPCSMITTVFSGYLYELAGRKITIFFSFITTAFILYALPYTAPSYSLLVLCRCGIGITMAPPLSNPLVSDYIMKKQRGKAVALSNIGIILGEVVSMGVLFNLTKAMGYQDAFYVSAISCATSGFLFLFIVKDPDFKVLRSKMKLKQPLEDSPEQGGESLISGANFE